MILGKTVLQALLFVVSLKSVRAACGNSFRNAHGGELRSGPDRHGQCWHGMTGDSCGGSNDCRCGWACKGTHQVLGNICTNARHLYSRSCRKGQYTGNCGGDPISLCIMNGAPAVDNRFASGRCHCGEWNCPDQCRNCPAGYYQNIDTSQTACKVCPEGTFQANYGQSSCASCPAGMYQSANTGKTTCIACSPGKNQAVSGKTSCHGCSAGKYSDGPVCSDHSDGNCPTHKANGGCSSGNPHHLAWRSRCPVSCGVCTNPSHFVPTNAQCTECPAGYFQASLEQTQCVACPQGQLAAAANSGSCASCPNGRFQNNLAASDCKACPKGRHQDGTTSAVECRQCPATYFGATTGLASCTVCPAAKYTESAGMAECGTCNQGLFSTDGSVCQDCPAGWYSNAVRNACIKCPSGRYAYASGTGNAPGNADACALCPAGTKGSGDGKSNLADACEICANDEYQYSAGQAECTACSTCPAGFTETVSCGTGSGEQRTAVTDRKCRMCDVGKFRGQALLCASEGETCECTGTVQFGGDETTNGGVPCKDVTGNAHHWPCGWRTVSSHIRTVCALSRNGGVFAEDPTPGYPKKCYCLSGSSVEECTKCSAGKYQDEEGRSSCKSCSACAAGSYEAIGCSMEDGAVVDAICALCLPGTYTPAENTLTSCNACPSGHFQEKAGEIDCKPCDRCAAGKRQVVNCTVRTNTLCSACSVGTYSTASNTMLECIACPSGFLHKSDSAKTRCEAANKCQPGSRLVEPSTPTTDVVCSVCVAGTFSTQENAESCTSCAAGTSFQPRANATTCQACTVCLAGQFESSPCSAASDRICENCPAGSYSTWSNADACILCQHAQFQPGQGMMSCKDLTECQPGSRLFVAGTVTTDTVCLTCAAGTYSGDHDALECTECPTNWFQEAANRTLCVQTHPCGNGSMQIVEHTSTTDVKCSICSAGQYGDESPATGPCKACAVGYFQSEEGATGCKPCDDVEKFCSSEGSANPEVASGGFYTIPVSLHGPNTGQVECPRGFSCMGGVKTVCDAVHQWCPAGSVVPWEVQAGFYSHNHNVSLKGNGTANTNQMRCPAGYKCSQGAKMKCISPTSYCPDGAATEILATAGYYTVPEGGGKMRTGQVNCDTSLGEYCKDGARANATICSVGKYEFQAPTDKSDRLCAICGAGRFSDAKGSNDCKPCQGERYQTEKASSSCEPCRTCLAGQFVETPCSALSDRECQPCASLSFTSSSNSPSCATCTSCGAGTYTLTTCTIMTDTMCADCPGGFAVSTTTPGNGIQDCSACPAGTFANASTPSSLRTCMTCPEGYTTYSAEFGAAMTTQIDCLPNCGTCASGRFEEKACWPKAPRECADCVPGQFQPGTNNESCITCPTGRYQDAPGQSACKASDTCKPGSMQVVPPTTTTDVVCSVCVAGKMSVTESATSCASCVAGQTFQLSNNATTCDVCTDCSRGTFISAACTTTTDRTCQACAPGMFIGLKNQNMCNACADGATYQNEPNASTCKTCRSCSAGTFELAACVATTDRICADCPPGAHCSALGVQTSCDLGFWNCSGSATRQVQCPPGHFCRHTRVSYPAPCASGSYQPEAGKLTCVSCKAGTFMPGTKATVCAACPIGTFQPSPSAIECEMCAPGRAQPATGGAACVACVGTGVESSADRSSCACADHFYSPLELESSDLKCKPCPIGALCCNVVGRNYNLVTKRGYWRPPVFSEQLFACPVADACLGTNTNVTSCKTLRALAAAMVGGNNATNSTRTTNEVCFPGHGGPGCGICEAGYQPTSSGMCRDCREKLEASEDDDIAGLGHGHSVKAVMAACGTLIVIVVWVLVEVRYQTSGASSADDALELELGHQLHEAKENVSSSSSQLDVLLPYVQRIGALDIALPAVSLPPLANGVVVTFKVALAKFSELFMAISPCMLHMGYRENLGLALIIVPCLALCAVLVYVLVLIILRRRRGWHRAETRARLLGGLLYSSKLLHPFISQLCLEFLLCLELGEGDLFIRADLEIACALSDPAYVPVAVASLVGCVVYVVGIPATLLLFVVQDRRWAQDHARFDDRTGGSAGSSVRDLFHTASSTERVVLHVARKKHRNLRRAHAKLHRALTLFMGSTKDTYYWFFILDMCISFVFIAFLGTLGRDYVEIQITLSILVAVLQLLVPASLRPYKDPADTRAAVIGSVVFGAMQLAMLTKYFAMTAEHDNNNNRHLVDRLATIDIALNIIFAVGVCCLFFATLKGLTSTLFARCGCAKCFRVLAQRKSKAKILPVNNAARFAGPQSRNTTTRVAAAMGRMRLADARAADDDIWGSKLPNAIVRPPLKALRRLDEATLTEYVSAFRRLNDLHLHVTLVAIQAVVRGKKVRKRARVVSTAAAGQMKRLFTARDADTDAKDEDEDTSTDQRVVAVWGDDEDQRHMSATGTNARGTRVTSTTIRAHSTEERASLVQSLHDAHKEGLDAGAVQDAERKIQVTLMEYGSAELAELLLATTRDDDKRLALQLHKEAALERALEGNKRKLVMMQKRRSLVRAPMTEAEQDKHDKAQARAIIRAHDKEFRASRQQQQQERRRSLRSSKQRNERRRLRHVIATLRRAVEAKAGDEAVTEESMAAMLDKNGDGEISLQELWGVMQSLTLASGHAITRTDASRILREFGDDDDDESVSVDELLQGMFGSPGKGTAKRGSVVV